MTLTPYVTSPSRYRSLFLVISIFRTFNYYKFPCIPHDRLKVLYTQILESVHYHEWVIQLYKVREREPILLEIVHSSDTFMRTVFVRNTDETLLSIVSTYGGKRWQRFSALDNFRNIDRIFTTIKSLKLLTDIKK